MIGRGTGGRNARPPKQKEWDPKGPSRIIAEVERGMYVVSRDDKSGMWYVHLEGFAYVPVFGSFRRSKRAAQRIATERNMLI